MTPEQVEAYIVENNIDPESQEAYRLRQEAAGPGETSSVGDPFSWKNFLGTAGKYILAAEGGAGLVNALTGAPATLGSISGSSQGAVSGHMAAPTLATTPFSASTLPGATSIGAAPGAGLGFSMPAGTSFLGGTGASVAPAATAPGAAAATPAISTTPFSASTLPGATSIGAAPQSAWMKVLKNPWVQDAIMVGGSYALDKLRERSANKAIDKALEAQTASAAEARDTLNRAQHTSGQVYNQQRQDFQNQANIPYQTLGGLMGMSIPDVGPAPFAPGPSQAYTPPMPTTYARQRPTNVPSQGTAQPRQPQTLATMAVPGAQQFAAQQQNQSSYARMRAPDGEEQDVPAHLVPLFERKGAVRL